MRKTNRIVYWIATAWLSLGMLSTGIVQIMHRKEEVDFITSLEYPEYLLTWLGIVKMIGVIIVLVPGIPLLKEWTYAGFFFMMSGAVFSHVAAGEAASETLPALLLLTLTVVSWYFRPANRKISTAIVNG